MSTGHVILDLEGMELTPEDKNILQHPQVGGVILFKRNYESKKQLRHLTKQILECDDELLITVDQEGGRVQRFQEEFMALPAFAEYGKLYEKNPQQGLSLAQNNAYLMAKELLDCQISLSFTPVLDIDIGISAVIGDRSFHQDAEIVTAIAHAFISGMHKAGMPATGKHFPGHGSTIADSHLTLPVDSRAFETIENHDLKPFAKLCASLDAIMPAHVLYPEVDNLPACFSSFWLQNILRKRLNFTGVIVSDDLSMLGAKMMGDFLERTACALNAGCDLVIICHHRHEVIAVLDEFENYHNPESSQRLTQLRKSVPSYEV